MSYRRCYSSRKQPQFKVIQSQIWRGYKLELLDSGSSSWQFEYRITALDSCKNKLHRESAKFKKKWREQGNTVHDATSHKLAKIAIMLGKQHINEARSISRSKLR